jgi:mono/diheme cytochrome c family protein
VLIYLETGEAVTGEASPGMTRGEKRAAGDPERGESLFRGDIHFANEGPPCMGCHNIGSYGNMGGGMLGPDLTGSWMITH